MRQPPPTEASCRRRRVIARPFNSLRDQWSNRWLALLFLSVLSCSLRAEVNEPWSALYGGTGGEEMEGLWVTEEGGYMIVGASDSYNKGNTDAWIVKLNLDGRVEWQTTYGGDGSEYAIDIVGTEDRGYIVAGWSDSFGAGLADFWVVKLNATGDIEWENTYGGQGREQAWSVAPTSDGGYVVAGGTTSFGAGGADVWLLKLAADGQVLWQKAYGGPEDDGGGGVYGEYVARVLEDANGDYVLASNTYSFGAGDVDLWVFKVDSSGEILWQKTYGGQWGEYMWMFKELAGGGYIVPGVSETFSSDESGDLWVVKLDENGDVGWQKIYELPGHWHEALSLGATTDGGAIIGGYYEAPNDWQLTLLRLNGDGDLRWSHAYHYGWDWPNAVAQLEDGGYVMAGVAALYDQDLPEDLWVMRLAEDGTLGAGCEIDTGLDLIAKDTGVAPSDTEAATTLTNGKAQPSSASVIQTSATPNYLCGEPGGPPALKLSIANVVNGMVELRLSGPPGWEIDIQASTDLKQWTRTRTQAIPSKGELSILLESAETSVKPRFYRAVHW